MSSRVYFRFSSSTDFDYVSFEGGFITIGELKYLISKKTGVSKDRSTVIELFDSRTEEEYVNTNTMVAKNASVIAKRSPAVRAPPISAPTKTPLPPTEPDRKETDSKADENLDEALGPGAFAPDTREETEDATISQLVKGFGDVWRTDLNLPSAFRRGRGREMGRGRRGPPRVGRSNMPPLGYICHRCNTPGHFIDECPTNGDPSYDFVRVRYPTGIPSSMLEKDDQGGLLMPNGERARLKPNTEKFRQEMEGVPLGEPSVKRLMGPSAGSPPVDERLEELAKLLARNPLDSLTPLVMHVLPQARDADLRQGFLGGQPLDRGSFQQYKDEHNRFRAALEGQSTQPPPTWPQPPPPSQAQYVDGNWRQPYPVEDTWTQKRHSYPDYMPPRKPGYEEPPAEWHPRMRPSYYDAGYPHPPEPAERYSPEPPIQYPPPVSESGPVLPSKVVRLHSTPPTESRRSPNGNEPMSIEPPVESSHPLPYGFERSAHRPSTEAAERDSAQRVNHSPSRSAGRVHRRRMDHRESSDRSSSIKKSKTHRRSKEKSQHRRRDRERRANRKEVQDRASPPSERDTKNPTLEDDGLNRWEMDGHVPQDDAFKHDYMEVDYHTERRKSRSERRSRRESDH